MNKSTEELVREVLRALNLDAGEVALRKRFLRFDERDAAALRDLHTALMPSCEDFLDDLYAHWRTFERTGSLLPDDETVARLKAGQAAYFIRLTEGEYGQEYVANRLRVGVVHERVGLEPFWYLGAYSNYLLLLMDKVWCVTGGDHDRFLHAFGALIKIIFFDVTLALDTYSHAARRDMIALKEYAERIVAYLPLGVVVLTGDLKFLSVNARARLLFQMTENELAGRALSELLPGEALLEAATDVLSVGSAERRVMVDFAEGRRLRVTICSVNYRETENGARLLLVIEDLTKEERLRGAALENATRMRAIMASVADGVIVIDESGHIETFNHAAEEIFGYDASEVVGRDISVLTDEPLSFIHEARGSACETAEKSDTPRHVTRGMTAVSRDGRHLSVDVSLSETCLSGRRAFVAVVRDVTGRKRAEDEMRKMSSLIEQSTDMVMITDPQGYIEYVNPAFERATGYNKGEVVGEKPSILKSDRHDATLYQRMWQTIAAGDSFRTVFINRRKDGSLYYDEKTVLPLKDEAGNITHFVSTGRDITEHMRAQEKLHYFSHYDALTGLPNRALLTDRVKQSIARARWHERVIAVLLLDVDRFKNINDTLGHHMGDELLRLVGARLTAGLREGDTVARWGGDEFVILLEDVAAASDVAAIARALLSAFTQPFEVGGQEFFLTASVGISLFPSDGEDVNTLIKNADVAMYGAKEGGRNSYRFYTANMNAKAFERLALENSLRRALEREEFLLHYQPQVELRSGRVVGVEALLRWQHPEMGLVSPLEFVPLLEETGLIVPVGEWVLATACAQMRDWGAMGFTGYSMAVNISTHQFRDPGLLAAVERLLHPGYADPAAGLLELEITESSLMENVEQNVAKLRQLREMGVRLAIDDFGTGYSSLAYLKRFPIEKLKIDRSFIRDVNSDPDDAAIAEAVIAMAHSLHMGVVAEGVETEEQLAFLRRHGCDQIQGYLFSRPLPAADVTRMLREARRLVLAKAM